MLRLALLAATSIAIGAMQGVTARIDAVAWLAGNWEGQRGASTFEERWTTPAGGAMLAVSRTVSTGRMAGFEFLRIVERNGTLVYVAQPGGRPPTDFTLTRIGANEAVFENPAHDYPTTITYRLMPDGTLTATTAGAGGSKPETFSFARRRD